MAGRRAIGVILPPHTAGGILAKPNDHGRLGANGCLASAIAGETIMNQRRHVWLGSHAVCTDNLKRLALLLGLLVLVTGTWLTYRVANWARTLPDRILVQVDGQTVHRAIVAWTTGALTGDDLELQRQAVRCLREAATQKPASAEWILHHFGADLHALETTAAPALREELERLQHSLSCSAAAVSDE
jgi:hypothetical protein